MRQLRFITLAITVLLQTTNTIAGTPLGLLKKVGTFIDSAAVRGVDRRYIDAPEKPWQIIVKGNVNQSDVKMKAQGDILGLNYSAEPRLKIEPATYVGLWAGYRGYGFGYSINVSGDKGSYFTIGATGGSYGVNIRIHNFKNSEPDFKLNIDDVDIDSEVSDDNKAADDKAQLMSPIKVHTVIADGYYLFNGKHFSYAAAYDQSVIQKRSAGSLMAGAMYYYSSVDYADNTNADLIYFMKGIGEIKLWQGSVGIGYAYNWVPFKGMLVNAMVMPMVTLINKIRIYKYTTNTLEIALDPRAREEDGEEWYYENLRIEEAGKQTTNSNISINFDARLSLTYNFGRYFINAYGQFCNFRYHHDDSHGYMNDWYVNAALGIRL